MIITRLTSSIQKKKLHVLAAASLSLTWEIASTFGSDRSGGVAEAKSKANMKEKNKIGNQ